MGKIVPELLCADLTATKHFYLQTLGFSIAYERPEETFVYFSLAGADLMFEQIDGPGRRWITGALEKPLGRGMNLQIEVDDVGELHARVVARAAQCIYLPLEEKAYACGDAVALTRQFVVQDPDGYLLRFAEERG